MNTRLSRLATGAAVALAWASGCNKVTGTVDGEKVPALNSFYMELSDAYEDGDGLIVVVLTDVKDGCVVAENLNEDLNDAFRDGDAEAAADAWSEYMPDDAWNISIYMRVDDVDDTLKGETFNGVDWDEDNGEDGDAYIVFTHYTDALDEDYWLGEADSDDYLDSYYSDGGDLKITGHKPGQSIAGNFVTTVATTDDGDDQGDVKVQFSARRCEGAEDSFFDD